MDLSKVLMLDFHYGHMKPKYGDKCELLYTDTDSFVYYVKCEDFWKDMALDGDKYDLSGVSINEF